jgi:Ca-activated chloride channel family protein
MMFLHPLWFAALILLPLPWLFLRRRDYLPHSKVGMVGGRGGAWLQRAPLAAFTIGLALLIVCLARPQVREEGATQVIMSRDIIIGVDISGSMSAGFSGEIPKVESTGNSELDRALPAPPKPAPKPGSYPSYETPGKRRIDAAQSAVLRFVRHRYERAQGDRIGIQVFDTAPRWSWPLTDDLKMIYRKGLFISEGLGGGTNFGSIDPGPIDAAGEHFTERGQASSKVIILVTDGEDSISSDAWDRLSTLIHTQGIKLYVVNVGESYYGDNTDIARLAREVGGQTFRVTNAAEMAACFDSIDQLEKSPVEVQMQARFHDIFHFFAFAALGFLVIALVGEAVIISR